MSAKRILRIATRESALALWQAEHIKARIKQAFSDIEVTLVPMTSKGDVILDKPLALVGGKGHFTKELEDAMLEGRADMAVHSLKDVPTFIPKGLCLAAITARQDQSDVLLSHRYDGLDALPRGAVVGTTSLRRRMQLLAKRPDLKVRDLRGNVNTRLQKLEQGQYDAIILAYIGLNRLGLLGGIPYVQKLDFMIPPMGQAALGIEIVETNETACEVAALLNDEATFVCTQAERDFIRVIGAGCSAPVAVNSVIVDEGNERTLRTRAMIGYPDGTHIIEQTYECPIADADTAGDMIAQKMIEQGALDILAQAEAMAFKNERPERL